MHPAIAAGRVAVITGAASGIGRAAAERLAGLGMHLVLADHDAEALESVAGALRAVAMPLDVKDPAALQRERAVLMEQARGSGKPEAIIEKMVEGRIRKYYEEVVLLEQVWVIDGESRVRAVMQKSGGRLDGFVRFQLGEGIEKPEGPDFASEVAAVSGVSNAAE